MKVLLPPREGGCPQKGEPGNAGKAQAGDRRQGCCAGRQAARRQRLCTLLSQTGQDHTPSEPLAFGVRNSKSPVGS